MRVNGWSKEQAGEVLSHIEVLSLEAENYQLQRNLFKEELQTALEEKTEILQTEKISALEHLKIEQDTALQELTTRKDKGATRTFSSYDERVERFHWTKRC